MLDSIRAELESSGAKVKMVSAARLREIEQDLDALKRAESLNGLQRYIVDELYQLNVPEGEAEIRSILIVATPNYASRQITFCREGRPIPLLCTAGSTDPANNPENLAQRLNKLLAAEGYYVKYEPRLPRKRLAVRSGLARYGRNNITYIDGLGSFYSLALFFSNLPCTGETWGAVEQMELCNDCRACIENCPTGAIRKDRFLIDNERCLTRFNESAWPETFPAWIPKDAHNAVFECLRCQTVCPANRAHLGNAAPPFQFDEYETALLLSRAEFERLPQSLRDKLTALGWANNLAALARNLEALLAQSQECRGPSGPGSLT